MEDTLIWVVVVPEDEDNRVQEIGYRTEGEAKKRADHLGQYDDKYAEVWPVRFNFLPAPVTYECPPPNYWGVATLGKGTELHAYGKSSTFLQSELKDAVSSAWHAWREQQSTLGNHEVAAPDPTDMIREAFEENPKQLSLFPRELPVLAH